MSIEKRNKKDITQKGDVLSGENKGSMGIARRICYTNAKLVINAEKYLYNVGRGLAPAVFVFAIIIVGEDIILPHNFLKYWTIKSGG